MKKNYIQPAMASQELVMSDIICTSGGSLPGNNGAGSLEEKNLDDSVWL